MAAHLRVSVNRLSLQIGHMQREIDALNEALASLEVVDDCSINPKPKQPTSSSPPSPSSASQTPLLVLFDFETNGLAGGTQEIRVTEIGALAVDYEGQVQQEFHSFVNPQVKISTKAQQLTGITQAIVEKEPIWKRVGTHFNEWLLTLRGHDKKKEIVLSAHNGKRFDSRLLFFENQRHDVPFLRDLYHVDTLPLFKAEFPNLPSYSMKSVHTHVLGQPVPSAHNALDDCKGMANLIQRIQNHETIEKWMREHRESFDSVRKRCL